MECAQLSIKFCVFQLFFTWRIQQQCKLLLTNWLTKKCGMLRQTEKNISVVFLVSSNVPSTDIPPLHGGKASHKILSTKPTTTDSWKDSHRNCEWWSTGSLVKFNKTSPINFWTKKNPEQMDRATEKRKTFLRLFNSSSRVWNVLVEKGKDKIVYTKSPPPPLGQPVKSG